MITTSLQPYLPQSYQCQCFLTQFQGYNSVELEDVKNKSHVFSKYLSLYLFDWKKLIENRWLLAFNFKKTNQKSKHTRCYKWTPFNISKTLFSLVDIKRRSFLTSCVFWFVWLIKVYKHESCEHFSFSILTCFVFSLILFFFCWLGSSESSPREWMTRGRSTSWITSSRSCLRRTRIPPTCDPWSAPPFMTQLSSDPSSFRPPLPSDSSSFRPPLPSDPSSFRPPFLQTPLPPDPHQTPIRPPFLQTPLPSDPPSFRPPSDPPSFRPPFLQTPIRPPSDPPSFRPRLPSDPPSFRPLPSMIQLPSS